MSVRVTLVWPCGTRDKFDVPVKDGYAAFILPPGEPGVELTYVVSINKEHDDDVVLE